MPHFKPGDIVQHFKRETLSEDELAQNVYLYEIVGTAVHTETEEKLVVYRMLYGDGGLYARPAAMFYSEVDHEKYPESRRFERVEK